MISAICYVQFEMQVKLAIKQSTREMYLRDNRLGPEVKRALIL